jgi:hypothetical protein
VEKSNWMPVCCKNLHKNFIQPLRILDPIFNTFVEASLPEIEIFFGDWRVFKNLFFFTPTTFNLFSQP